MAEGGEGEWGDGVPGADHGLSAHAARCPRYRPSPALLQPAHQSTGNLCRAPVAGFISSSLRMLCAGVSPPPGHDWPIDGTSLAPMLRAQGRLARPSRAALGWVTGHYSSQAMTGLPVSSCDSGACPLTRYDHGRITRSIRPPVEQMAWLDNHLKLYANRVSAAAPFASSFEASPELLHRRLPI